MDKDVSLTLIRQKYQTLQHRLTERTRRLWAATEAHSLGHGGIALVHQAIGMDIKTIRRGLKEMNTPLSHSMSLYQSRMRGGGRKKLTEHYPDLPDALDTLIDPVMRGDPESPLRWTCQSTRLLAQELNRQGYDIGPSAVRFLLHELEYSLQGNKKSREGNDHPDRNDQFLYINKWNKIEHRLFSFITQNWRGKPLYDLVTVVNLISHTTTSKGLLVKSAVDTNVYSKGMEVSDEELAKVKLKPHDFHGEWNYTVKKGK